MERVTLRTERLVLSAPEPADVDAVYEACQDPLIQRYTTVPSPYARTHAEDFVKMTAQWWDNGSETTWVIRVQDVLCGVLGIHRIANGAGSGELGYWMSPNARGQGYLDEACRAALTWAFARDGLNLARIDWRAVAGNHASARVAQRLGFRFEGTMRGALIGHGGVREDAWFAGLLATDDRLPVAWPPLSV